MKFHVLTLFPDMVMQGLMTSITGRAVQQKKIDIDAVNIRDYTQDKHGRVDDYPYGGGAGMLMQAQPVYDACQSVMEKIPQNKKKRVIYVTPQGIPFTQAKARELAAQDELLLLCGHYEGIDERVLEEVVTDYISIGDYVLTGGELAAMVIVDAVARLVPGVLGNEQSALTESFHGELLEHPQYSRPDVWHGKKVPEVLLSGNQKHIDAWKKEQSILRTKERRPDLYARYVRLQECRQLLMKQKLLHIDMIELINRGRAQLLLELCDQDFVPPLSHRNSTSQTNWAETEEKTDGIAEYLENICSQHVVLWKEEGVVRAFMTWKDHFNCENLEAYPDSCYLTTLCVWPDYRGQGISEVMYAEAERTSQQNFREDGLHSVPGPRTGPRSISWTSWDIVLSGG